MHLLHTSTFKLVDVPSHDPPRYAILSHTWGPPNDEVLFDDIQSDDPERARSKPCFGKVEKACEKAREYKLEYTWIDTCCIDKRSSAELQEAINSMFKWYQRSTICFAYLSDVVKVAEGESYLAQFEKSRWFTRGWTLQELLAPSRLELFAKEWTPIGSRRGLVNEISTVTRIQSRNLRGSALIPSVPIATRMSWVAHRRTTRPEDIAYCLLGIFDVNMPLLYGEGPKAFSRLQEEIVKRSEDDSIFAWIDPVFQDAEIHGLFADSPSQFHHLPTREANLDITCPGYPYTSPFEVTAQGIRVEAELYPISSSPNLFIMLLSCHLGRKLLPPTPGNPSRIAIYGIVLRRLRGRFFGRVCVSRFASIEFGKTWPRVPPETIFVRANEGESGFNPFEVVDLSHMDASPSFEDSDMIWESSSMVTDTYQWICPLLISEILPNQSIKYNLIGWILHADAFNDVKPASSHLMLRNSVTRRDLRLEMKFWGSGGYVSAETLRVRVFASPRDEVPGKRTGRWSDPSFYMNLGPEVGTPSLHLSAMDAVGLSKETGVHFLFSSNKVKKDRRRGLT